MFEKGKSFMNFSDNTGKRSKNRSTYYIDVDPDNDNDARLVNLVRGATLLSHEYAVSQPSKSDYKSYDIGREQLSILAYQYCMPNSDYNNGRIPNTIISSHDPRYVQYHTKAFLDMIDSDMYRDKWIYPKDIERYAEETKEYDTDEIDPRYPYLYGKNANEI